MPGYIRNVSRQIEKRDRAASAEAPRVLLAEDDNEMRALLADALRRDGYDVVEVADGAEMLRLIASSMLRANGTAFDLVISDVRMPRWSGLQVAASLRTTDWSVPIILISAFGDAELHAAAARVGAVALLDKPFDIDDLRTAVWNAVPPPHGASSRRNPNVPT